MKNLIKLSLVSALTLSLCSPHILNASTSSTMTGEDLSLDVSKKMRAIYESIATRAAEGKTSFSGDDLNVHGKALVEQLARNDYKIPQDLLTELGGPLDMIMGTVIGELNLMEQLDLSVQITRQLANSRWSDKERTFRHFPWSDPDGWDDAIKKQYFAKLLPVLKPQEALFLTPGSENFNELFVSACMEYAPDRETQVRYAQALLRNLELTDLSKKSPLTLDDRLYHLEVGVPDALRLGLLDRTSGAVTLGISALLEIYHQEIAPLIALVSESSSANDSDNDDASEDDEDPGELIEDFTDTFASYMPHTQDYVLVLSTLEQLMSSKIGLFERITLLRAMKKMNLRDQFSRWNSFIKDEISKGEDPLPWLHVLYIPVADMPEGALRTYVTQNLKRDASFESLISLALGAHTKFPDYAKRLVTQEHLQTFDDFFNSEENFKGLLEEAEDDDSSMVLTSTALAVFLNESEFPRYFDGFIDMIKRNTSPKFFRSECDDLYAFDLMRAQPGGHAQIQQRIRNMHSEGIKRLLN